MEFNDNLPEEVKELMSDDYSQVKGELNTDNKDNK